jgi:hypothetical protein
MQTHPLRLLLPIAILLCTISSCVGPAYVETTPPPPDYSQAPPPPPQQPYYSDQQAIQPDATAPVSYQTFYNELSPYGQWINTPDYGYVWTPAAGPDFQPYATSGHWVLTNYGWTWVSDYSWGWAPFHYGTWDFDGTIGWFWIPGYQWSPAWVSWRSEPGYYGWAPLGPTYANVGYANYYCPPERYVFVSATYINSPDMSVYYVPRAQNATYYGHSAVVTNTYYDHNSNNTYYAGPQREEVERYTGRQIQPAAVTSAATPEKAGYSGGQVTMYRPPVVRPDNNAPVRPAPQTVYDRNNVTPVTQRQVLTHPNQARATPFQPENIQHGQNNQQPPANNEFHATVQQQQPQQKPAIQQPTQERPVQQQNQVAPLQSPPANNQYHAPIQQQRPQQNPVAPQQPQNHAPVQQSPQQRPGMQQQHSPAQQRPVKPQPKQAKPQPKQNQTQAPAKAQ